MSVFFLLLLWWQASPTHSRAGAEPDSLEIGRILRLGEDAIKQHKFKEAKEHIVTARDRAEAYRDTASEIKVALTEARMYHEMGNLSRSDEEYQKALLLAQKTSNTPLIAEIRKGEANNHIARGQYAEAQKLYFDLAKTYESQGKPHEYAAALSVAANLYRRLGQVAKAEAPLLRVYKIQKGSNEQWDLITTTRYLGMLYTDLKQYAFAEKYLKESLELSRLFESNSDIIRVYYAMDRLYFSKGDLENGDQYQKRVIRFRDSLYTSENNKALAEFEVKYKTAEKDKKILEAEYRAAIKNTWILGLCAALVLISGSGWILWTVREARQKSEMQQKELDHAHHILNAREKERHRIAQELHDSVASQLTIVSTGLDNALFTLQSKQSLPALKLSAISEDLRTATQSLRDTVWVTHNTVITTTGLYDRIRQYLSRVFDENSTVTYTTRLSGESLTLNAMVIFNLFRIVQEAVQNIQKHSGASHVQISVENTSDILTLSIKDNGRGFDPESQVSYESFGLGNMKKRSEDIGALCEILSLPDGTEIRVSMRCTIATSI